MSFRQIILVLGYVLALNLFFFETVRGLGTALFFLVTHGVVCALFWKKSAHFSKNLLVFTAIQVVIAAILVLRDSAVIQQLLTTAGFLSTVAFFYLSAKQTSRFSALTELLLFIPITLRSYLSSFPKNIQTLQRSTAQSSLEAPKKIPFASLLLGLLASIPIVVILVFLLSGADPIFAKKLSDLFQFDGVDRLISRVVLSVSLITLLLPAVITTFPDFRNPVSRLRQLPFATEFSVILTLCAAVLGFFVIIQWQYIFIPSVSGVDLTQFGFSTYSAYVQKGFTEFIFASALIFSLLWIGLLFYQGSKNKLLFYLQLLVAGEFAVLLLSFFRRIWLYQSYHGMTLIRFYGGALMLVIGIFLITLVLRHLRKRQYVMLEAAALILSVVILGSWNIEHYIVKHPPTVNERIDHMYLSRLSADGVHGWIAATKHAELVQNELLAQESTISAEQRRELAYAGVSIRQVTHEYLSLLELYGTEDEKRAAQKLFAQYTQKQYAEYAAAIEKKRSELITYLENAAAAEKTAGNDVRMPYQSDTLQAVERNSEAIKEILHTLSTTPETASFAYRPIQNYGYFLGNYFTLDTLCMYDTNCIVSSVGNLHATEKVVPRSFMSITFEEVNTLSHKERLLRYSESERRAFAVLSSQLPLPELLLLTENHFKLFDLVYTLENSDSRSFPPDISLETPLLEALE